MSKKGGRWCSASGCTSNSKEFPFLSFYKFPKNEKLARKWSKSLGREDLLQKSNVYCHVCEKHFNTLDICKLSKIKRLNKNAIPQKSVTTLEESIRSKKINDLAIFNDELKSDKYILPPVIFTKGENTETEFILNEEGNMVEIEMLNEVRPIFQFREILEINTIPSNQNDEPEIHKQCIIPSCKHLSKIHDIDDLILFPKYGTDKQRLWLESKIINLLDQENYYICKKHFTMDSFDNLGRLKKCILPTLYLDNNLSSSSFSYNREICSQKKLTDFELAIKRLDNNFNPIEEIVEATDNFECNANELKRNKSEEKFSLKSCLICLEKDGTSLIYNAESSEISLAKKIEFIADISIMKNDGSPYSICIECTKSIINGYKLKIQCQNSINIFKNFLELNARLQENNIKSEPLDYNIKSEIQDISSENQDFNIISKTIDSNINYEYKNDNFISASLNYNINSELQDYKVISAPPLDSIIIFEEYQEVEDGYDYGLNDDNNEINNSEFRDNTNFEVEEDQESFNNNNVEERLIDLNKLKFDKDIQNITKCDKMLSLKTKELSKYKQLDYQKFQKLRVNRKMKCNICGKVVNGYCNLIEHKILHTDEKPYECYKCSKKFQQKIKLLKHQRLHTQEHLFLCEVCSRQYKSIHELNIHKLVHGTKDHECMDCGRLFYSKYALNKHAKKHMGLRLSCDECDKTFSNKSALNTHKKSFHLGIKRFKCVVCDKEFYNLSNYKAHVRTHTGEKPFACDYCDKKLTHSRLLKNHIIKHHGVDTREKTYSERIVQNCQCFQCGSKFSNFLDLVKHVKLHSVDTKFQCKVCKKKFVSANHLSTHIKSHTIYQCRICEDKFLNATERLRHERISHDNVLTSYKCSICGKFSNSSTNLNIHMRVHTGEKPYNCTHCDKKFADLGNRNAHIRIHTGEKPYSCKVCDAKYIRMKYLRNHIAKEHLRNNSV